MTRCKFLYLALLLVLGFAVAPRANAATVCGSPGTDVTCVHWIGVGSSAMYQGTLASVFDEVAPLFNNLAAACAPATAASPCQHHWTMKSTSVAACSPLCAALEDPRFHPIQEDASNVWITWVEDGTAAHNILDVWVFHQIDSGIGDRAYLSRAAGGGSAGISLIPGNTQIGQNVVSSSLLDGVADYAAALPANLVALINNVPVTAAFSDIRAEDALYSNERACSPHAANLTGLGYSTSKTCGATFVGTPFESAYSATEATPIAFSLPGFADPVNAVLVPKTIITYRIGEDPVLFIVNRSNATGLGDGIALGVTGDYQNLNDGGKVAGNPLGKLYSGTSDCDGANTAWTPGGGGNFPINLIQREAMSGTMNTTEFSVFRAFANGSPDGQGNSETTTIPAQSTSQEANAGAPVLNTANDPLDKPCAGGGGNQLRALGTSELVNQVICGNAAACSGNAPAFAYTDTLGYAFFSFGNVKSASLSKNYGYVTLDDVDPIFETFNNGGAGASGTSPDPGQPAGGAGYGANSGTYWPGTLPQCTTTGAAGFPNCTEAAIWGAEGSFPNLRNGSYRAWTLLSALCDPAQTVAGVDECSVGSVDPGSLGNVIDKAQKDIHNNVGSPDYLPFSVTGAFTEIGFVRSHFNFQSTETAAPFNGPPTHTTPGVKFYDPNGTTKNAPIDLVIGGGPDAGGDAGGCMEDATTGGVTITSGKEAASGVKVKLFYTQVAGANALATGDVVTLSGLTGALATLNGTTVQATVTAGPPASFKAPFTAAAGTVFATGGSGAVTQCSQ
jgi:hypothetical protein